MGYSSSDYDSYQTSGDKTPTLSLWQDVLLSPSTDTFAKYLGEADLGRAVLWLLASSAIGGLLQMLSLALGSGKALLQALPPEMRHELPIRAGAFSFGTLLCGIPTWIVVTILGAFIGVGLIHLVAKLLSGEGDFTETFFLMTAASAPITLISGALGLLSGLLGLIPFLGAIFSMLFGLVGMVVGIYNLVLSAMAVAAAHRFSLGKGFAAVLLPLVVFILLGCCCAFAGLMTFSSDIEDVFEEIQRELNMLLTLYV
ncbi:MAG: Yip1 family protein [Chloroflexota bacterium]|nr:Yip1 family protein [Chloroflexota bacterium]